MMEIVGQTINTAWRLPATEFRRIRAGMGYPDVPEPEIVPWREPDPDYQTVEYTSTRVKRAVPDWDHPDLDAVWERTLRLSQSSVLRRDPVSGRPLHPGGRTGITGYGGLRNLGVNRSADLWLTRGEGADTELLLIERNTGLLAPPGGFVNELPDGTMEPGVAAAIRETDEEMKIDVRAFAERAVVLSNGPTIRSMRTTDNAWIENLGAHIRLSGEEGQDFVPAPSDDAGKESPGWVRLADIDPRTMGDHHAVNLGRLRTIVNRA